MARSKLVHFYKYESEISLEQGRAFAMNGKGQIMEINLPKLNAKSEDEGLSYYLKNIERVMGRTN